MKRILLLAICCLKVYAEEPPSEMQAKEEIENFLIEEPMQDLQFATPILLNAQIPEQEVVPLEEVELAMEGPSIPAEILTVPSIEIDTKPSIIPQIILDPEEDMAALQKEEKEVAAEIKSEGIIIDLNQVFSGSPTIYTILFFLSVSSLAIGAYAFASLRTPELIPSQPLQELREKLIGKQYEQAMAICNENPSILFKMVGSGIQSRALGTSTMLELMKAEGKRASHKLWQRISLLNDIAIIAPMLGLLGTVLGMFYAFYDLNRSMESISALFDGLGISVGTTVGGLVVALIAIFFHTMSKQRLMKQLILIESKASSLAHLIDNTQGNV